jgi:hypothetical protein
MAAVPAKRRPVNVAVLDAHVRAVKLRRGVELPAGRKKTVPLPREAFVPVVQADVGGPVALLVQRYRVLVPVAQIIRESLQAVRRLLVATQDHIEALQAAFIQIRRPFSAS